MKKILFVAIGIATLSLTACKKDDSIDNPGGTPSKLLKKITKTENGETTVYNFTYNGKRLTSYKSTDGVEEILFTYDGAGNIVKVEQKDEEFKNTYIYTYNNGVPVSGTFKSLQKHPGEPDELIEDDALTYTVENGVVSNIHLYMGMYDEEIDFQLSYTNGNLTKIESTGFYPYSATFTYGNKKAAFPQLSKYVLDQAGFSLQFFAKNDMLSAAFDFPGTELDNAVVTQYTYDAAGYPLTSNDGETQLQFEYQ